MAVAKGSLEGGREGGRERGREGEGGREGGRERGREREREGGKHTVLYVCTHYIMLRIHVSRYICV